MLLSRYDVLEYPKGVNKRYDIDGVVDLQKSLF